MYSLYNVNGLIFWSDKEIRQRRYFEDYLVRGIEAALLQTNPAWRLTQIEAPLLTPRELLNPNYTAEDIWIQRHGEHTDKCSLKGVPLNLSSCTCAFIDSNLALRPETTPGSYSYAIHLLNSHTGTKPPFVIWQAGKSFRREQDQVSKNMRLKEFYQLELQCIYTADTANDYHSALQEPVRKLIAELVNLPTRLISSDRLPSYSEVTVDVEVDNGDKWMEVCSISRRTDFSEKAKFTTKSGIVEKGLLVLEIAIGLDRLIYNWLKATENG